MFQVQIHAHFDIGVLDLQRRSETAQGAKGLLQARLHAVDASELKQRAPQGRREQGRQRPLLGRLDPHRRQPAGFGVQPDPVEQNGLSDPSQSVKNDAARRLAGAYAVKRHGRPLDDLIAARQFRRRRTGSGRVGVLAGVQLERP